MERPSMKLSILMCRLKERKDAGEALMKKLEAQIGPSRASDVQVIGHIDDRGMSIGKKRNLLMEIAVGEYVAFVDDDDDVADDYVDSILAALETSPDCVGIEGIFHLNDNEYNFKHSIEYQGWYTGTDGYYRTPNHLNPIKRDIAMKIRFPEIMNGEDRIFSDTIRRLLKTEVYIDHPIYFYRKVVNENLIH